MWKLPIALVIVVGYVIQPILNKKVADDQSQAHSLVWIFGFASVFGLLAHLWFQIPFQIDMLAVVCLGGLNACANFAYLSTLAGRGGLTVASVFAQLDDLITMGLGLVLLHETHILTSGLAVGVVLLVGASLLFSWDRSLHKATTGTPSHFWRLFRWIVLYSAVWGLANFAMRYFSLQAMPLLSYVVGWYGGSFIGAIVLYAISSRHVERRSFTRKQIATRALLAVSVMTSLALAFWARSLAPLTVTQPILQLSEMILPTCIGLWIFKERVYIGKAGWIAIGISLLGGTLIVLNY